MKKFKPFFWMSLIATATAVISVNVNANANSLNSLTANMDIAFQGIPVGTLNNTITLNQNKYTINGEASSNLLGDIFAKVDADFNSSGTIKNKNTKPNDFGLNYTYRQETNSTKIKFKNNKVKQFSNEPKFEYKKDAVEVTKKHFVDVIDPASTILFPVNKNDVGDGNKICDRTIPIFDGAYRVNLKMKYKKTQQKNVEGFNGHVFVCSVQYQPVAGHRPNSKTTQFLTENKNIEFGVARIQNTNIYALFSFSLPIRYGVITGKTQKFVAN